MFDEISYLCSVNALKGKKAVYYTLGCKLNFAETSTIQKQMEAAGVETAKNGETADICIVNTCSVTEVADSKIEDIEKDIQITNRLLAYIKEYYGTTVFGECLPFVPNQADVEDLVNQYIAKCNSKIKEIKDKHPGTQGNYKYRRNAFVFDFIIERKVKSFNFKTDYKCDKRYLNKGNHKNE